MEEKYWELREAVERAYDKCYAHNTAENHIAYLSAKQIFENFFRYAIRLRTE